MHGCPCAAACRAAIPLLITGGFHVDGFMDTMDAVHSYQPKEKKLEILKDSHIGAFAVIMLAAYGMVYLAALSEIENRELEKIMCSGFFLSRCLCGISAVSFPLAKKEGMLYAAADSSQKIIVKSSLYLQSAICIGLMVYCGRAFCGRDGNWAACPLFLPQQKRIWRSDGRYGGLLCRFVRVRHNSGDGIV